MMNEQKYRNLMIRRMRANDRRKVKRAYESGNAKFKAAYTAQPEMLAAVIIVRGFAELADLYIRRHPTDY